MLNIAVKVFFTSRHIAYLQASFFKDNRIQTLHKKHRLQLDHASLSVIMSNWSQSKHLESTINVSKLRMNILSILYDKTSDQKANRVAKHIMLDAFTQCLY